VISSAEFDEMYDPGRGVRCEKVDLSLINWREWQAHDAGARVALCLSRLCL
jgi:hypothetical protein